MDHPAGIHLGVLPFWLIAGLFVFPFTWLALNDVAWEAGFGTILTERPLAAVHHRINGTLQEFENAGEAIAYYEGHLRGIPDASPETRVAWQHDLDHARSQQTSIVIKWVLVTLATYIPVGLILDRWYRQGLLTPEFTGA